jgi:5'-3' exonuclease
MWVNEQIPAWIFGFVDASGWIFRFLKAMRNEQGDILPNAHTIGFLRRICKLLYLNIRPVFVFDGSTPALKKRTVAERRRRREQQDARVKRTAEKLLMNRLKQHIVREMEQRSSKPMESEVSAEPKADVMVKPNVGIAENVVLNDKSASSSEDLEGFEVDVEDGVDPEVLSTLPPSMQLEIMLQVREKAMAAARGGFESRNGRPEEFSEYQMKHYLDSTGLRRQLDAIRGVAQQNSDVAKPVAGEQDKHYILYREDADVATGNQRTNDLEPGNPPHKSQEKQGKNGLNISFCIQEHEMESDDMEWEDVDPPPTLHGTRHQRSKYWSLSHGFQKGRSLGNWGDDLLVDAKKGKEVVGADEEQAMLQEAIRRSLAEHRESSPVPASSNSMPLDEEKYLAGAMEAERNTEGAKEKDEVREKTQLSPSPNVSFHEKAIFHEGISSAEAAKKEELLEKMSNGGENESSQQTDEGPAAISVLPAENEMTADTSQHLLPIMENVDPDANSDLKDKKDKSICIPTEKNENLEAAREIDNPLQKGEVEAAIQKSTCHTSSSSEKEEKRTNSIYSSKFVQNDKIPILLEDEDNNGGLRNTSMNANLTAADATTTAGNSTPLPRENFDLEELIRQEASLRAERRAATGQSDSPTDEMFKECQELLQLCGIPYIIAPTEAEAQCAWLDDNNLVDGVVTDDNDAFLFGARRVYRHIFEENKYVEEYRTDDIEREIGLSRNSLISLALLLGSDYTPGIGGVGIVNAVEIVSTFSSFEELLEFEKWVNGIDEDLVALVKSQAPEEGNAGEDPKAEFKQKHKSVRKSWVLPDDFPSREVMEAYEKPALDDSKSRFTFVKPDFPNLKTFCSRRFGWDEGKIDDLLGPVQKALQERDKQQTIDGFITFREKFAKVRSKRLAEAVAKVKNKRKK